jgi:hypothetical protein
VFIEVKQREDRTLQKRRLCWPVERVERVFGGGAGAVDWTEAERHPVATEVALMIDRLRLRPRVAVSYRRRALFGAFDPELRVTFDGRIHYHPAHFALDRPFEIGRYGPAGDGAGDRATTVPLWLSKAITRHGLDGPCQYCSAVEAFLRRSEHLTRATRGSRG